VINICLDEAVLLFGSRVFGGVASIRLNRIVLVICPLREVIGKLVAWDVGSSIFEVDDD